MLKNRNKIPIYSKGEINKGGKKENFIVCNTRENKLLATWKIGNIQKHRNN